LYRLESLGRILSLVETGRQANPAFSKKRKSGQARHLNELPKNISQFTANLSESNAHVIFAGARVGHDQIVTQNLNEVVDVTRLIAIAIRFKTTS
jgi:hypothetical protein